MTLAEAAQKTLTRVLARCEPVGDCLLWTGACTGSGTPVVSFLGSVIAVSKVVWLARYGELPEVKLQRSCAVQRCVNVVHLREPVPFDVEDHFWSNVNVDGPPHPTRPELGCCWLWTGTIHATGYGWTSERAKEECGQYAHRLSFLIANGFLTPDLMVRHSCDRRPCVRPTHLDEGTNLENVHDREVRFYGRRVG